LQRRRSRTYRTFSLFLAFTLILFLLPDRSYSQDRLLPLNKTFDLSQERLILEKGQSFHSAFQPYSERDFSSSAIAIDSVQEVLSLSKRKEYSGVWRKLFYEHLFILDSQNVKLTLDPIYHFEYTKESDGRDETLFKNSRGFLLLLQLGENVAVGSSFLENQARLPSYVAQRVDATDVAYGQGRVKQLDTAYYDFAMSSAYLTYSPSDWINLTIGHGKHFIGNGFRSHLLSDLAFNYPYLKIKTNWLDGKLQYQNLFNLYQDLERVPSNEQTEELFERKMGATHYLSIIPHPKIEIGLFESTIYPSIDTSGKQEIPFQAYVPILFLNTLADDSDILAQNLGLNLSIKPIEDLMVYSQLSSQNLDEGLTSFQIGAKYFLMNGLRIGVEFNSVKTDSIFGYHHYNESLGLPYSGNQNEIIGSAQYMWKRWNLLARGNLYQGDVEQRFMMGELSYMVNPAVNSNLYVNLTHRDVDNLLLFSFGWRTSLQNLYFNY